MSQTDVFELMEGHVEVHAGGELTVAQLRSATFLTFATHV